MRKINMKPDRKIMKVVDAYAIQPQTYKVGHYYSIGNAKIASITGKALPQWRLIVQMFN